MQIHVIIETSLLLEEYSNPSTDPKNPTMVSNKFLCVVKAGESDGFFELGENKIKVKKDVVDEISFHVISESANFDSPVLLYDLKHHGENEILDKFLVSASEIDTIVPISFDPLETTIETRMFLVNKILVTGIGVEEYGIYFGVFSYDFTSLGYFEFRFILEIE
ncbi:hypothetical protein L1276_004484 [Flavobacterium sp. HSC-32F16]|uniref:AidA/PixA family protein n=1 Tax=Flavobacterium sp. HSC-32F16 TaxID=2910964 RepID=UPI0020A466CE|nr:AidA/PixA family protein [Flavobacterium sp. HSC-32F16]MCP2029300.1 hypothetical protein [Flavobacterium sp. HSC-32F16]